MAFEYVDKQIANPRFWSGFGWAALWFGLALVVGLNHQLFFPLLPVDAVSEISVSMRTFENRTPFVDAQKSTWAFLAVTWPIFFFYSIE